MVGGGFTPGDRRGFGKGGKRTSMDETVVPRAVQKKALEAGAAGGGMQMAGRKKHRRSVSDMSFKRDAGELELSMLCGKGASVLFSLCAPCVFNAPLRETDSKRCAHVLLVSGVFSDRRCGSKALVRANAGGRAFINKSNGSHTLRAESGHSR